MNPVKLQPVYKDYIWGGTKLKNMYKKGADRQGRIAESWELSAHPDGESLIADGKEKGMPLSEYLKKQGGNMIGSKSSKIEPPVLIKFIDARENLSVQVHPDNAYAIEHEHDYGKTEMWAVISHEPGAALYYGVKEKLTKEEMRKRIREHTVMDVLNRVEVQDGDVFFIPAGTIHAIGAGMVICEIQQRSNVTYRLYDYGRVGPDGRERKLHIEKALDVANLDPVVPYQKEEVELCSSLEYQLKLLGSCEYFHVFQYDFKSRIELSTSRKTFLCLIMIKGGAVLQYPVGEMEMQAGETVFLPAQEMNYQIWGQGEFLAVSL